MGRRALPFDARGVLRQDLKGWPGACPTHSPELVSNGLKMGSLARPRPLSKTGHAAALAPQVNHETVPPKGIESRQEI